MAQTVYTDDFSGSGDLNGSAVGTSALTWSVVSGSATRSSGKALFAQAPSASPFAVVDVSNPLVDARVDTYTGFAGGDALYFSVTDASNWWRLRCRTSQSSGTYQSPYYTFGPWVETVDQTLQGSAPNPGTTYRDYLPAYPDGTPTPTTEEYQQNLGTSPQTFRDQLFKRTATHPTVSYTNDVRYLMLEKSVAGTITQVGQWTVSAFGTLRVSRTTAGFVVYSTDAATQLATITDTFNSAATKVGVGLGGTNDNYATGSSLDNFSATIPPPPGPPVITTPLLNADVDIAAGSVTIVQSNAATVADPQTAGAGRWRQAGDTDWTEIDTAFGTGTQWVLDVSALTAPVQIEVQANWTDTQSTTASGWSDSVFFTLRQAPSAPVYISPAPGSTVVATDIAVVDFDAGAASTSRQARRVADVGGSPDNATVYQAALTLTGPDSDGYYLLTGDATIHPTGAEHVQVRRQTADGGTLWSPWTDLPVEMSQAQPYPPTVVYTPILASAYVQVRATFTPGDADHVDAVQAWIFRDGERVQIVPVTDGVAVWTDQTAPTAGDYRVAAAGANGTVAFADETSTVGTPDDSSPVLDDGTPDNPLGAMIT